MNAPIKNKAPLKKTNSKLREINNEEALNISGGERYLSDGNGNGSEPPRANTVYSLKMELTDERP